MNATPLGTKATLGIERAGVQLDVLVELLPFPRATVNSETGLIVTATPVMLPYIYR